MKSELVHISGTKQGAENPELLKLVSFFGALGLGLWATDRKNRGLFYNVGVQTTLVSARLGTRIIWRHRRVIGEVVGPLDHRSFINARRSARLPWGACCRAICYNPPLWWDVWSSESDLSLLCDQSAFINCAYVPRIRSEGEFKRKEKRSALSRHQRRTRGTQ